MGLNKNLALPRDDAAARTQYIAFQMRYAEYGWIVSKLTPPRSGSEPRKRYGGILCMFSPIILIVI